MGRFYDDIPQSHFEWIKQQHTFWVATAPLSVQGHINVSPKGIADCFHVVNSKQVWYEDLSGSGVETISHVQENGRITVMFCAFEGPPRILRLFGIGTVHEYGSPEYNRLIPATSRKPGSRAAIVIDVYQVGSSCGYAVPLYDFVMHRTQLHRMVDKIEDVDRARVLVASDRQPPEQAHGTVPGAGNDDGAGEKPELSKPRLSLRTYWLLKNMKSLDGLPGLVTAPGAILRMTPQNNFDRDTPRPMVHRRTQVASTARDRKWFASGFVLGAVTVFALTRLAGSLKE
ncbi:hypothetical protein EV363DRAFT_1336472 [Boletus edulis]|nr:hypothetical protein EV363DRAFT_1336472 [Boletus edulis]